MVHNNFKHSKNRSGMFKPASILLILISGWILLSKCGYLPLAFSFPGELSRQAYGSPYKIAGYGFDNQMLNLYNNGKKSFVKAGTFDSFGILKNTNFSGRYAYYSYEDNSFYIDADAQVYQYFSGTDKFDTVVKSLGGSVNSYVYFDNMFIGINDDGDMKYQGKYSYERLSDYSIEDNSLITSYERYEDEQGNTVRKVVYNYKPITNALYANETKPISLNELSALLYISRYNVLEGWYPETNTAVFRYRENNMTTFITYTIGDEEEKKYGPYDLSGCELISINEAECYLYDSREQSISRWNFVTNEKNKLCDAPILSMVCMNLQKDGSLLLAGLQEDSTMFVYSSAKPEPKIVEINDKYNSHLAIGEDGVFFWTHKDLSSDIPYAKYWNLKEDYD